MWRSLSNSWRALQREMGTAWACVYMLHRALQASSGGHARIVPYALFAQPVGSPALAAVRDDAATQVVPTTPQAPWLDQFPRPHSVIAARFANAHECFSVLVKGEFAGYAWIAQGRYEEDEVRCEYVIADPTSGVWDFDVFVAPRFRLGRTMARLWKAVDAALSARRVSWSFSRISRFNSVSISSHQRLGAVCVGHAVFIAFGALQFAFLTQAPFMQVSLKGRPRVRLICPMASPHPRC